MVGSSTFAPVDPIPAPSNPGSTSLSLVTTEDEVLTDEETIKLLQNWAVQTTICLFCGDQLVALKLAKDVIPTPF